MKTLLDYRSEVREAIWLWWHLNAFAPHTPDKWLTVNNGAAYNDEGIASGLDVTATTVRRWRLKLEKAGLIRGVHATRRKRRYEVLNLSFSEKEPVATSQTISAVRTAAVN